MEKPTTIPRAKHAILTMAEIKAVIEAFDRGDINVFAALDQIGGAIEAYCAAASPIRDAA